VLYPDEGSGAETASLLFWDTVSHRSNKTRMDLPRQAPDRHRKVLNAKDCFCRGDDVALECRDGDAAKGQLGEYLGAVRAPAGEKTVLLRHLYI
jgi:hypothetical protein